MARVRRDLSARNGEVRAARQGRRRGTSGVQPALLPSGGASLPAPGQAGAQPATGQGGGASSVAPPSTAAAAAPANPGGVSFPQGRPTLTSNDGRFSAAVGLQLHYDIGGTFQGDRMPDTHAVNRLNTFGENLRRGRIPFVFKYDDFQVNLTPDFGGSPDGSPTLFEANIN